MSKATAQITDGDSLRNQEQKDKEDFATQNYPREDILGDDVIAAERLARKRKESEENKVDVKSDKFNVNFIDDETFNLEFTNMIYHAQGESIVVLGPRVKLPTSDIKLSEKDEADLIAKELKKHEPAYRVLTVSPQVVSQITDMAKKMVPATDDTEEFNTFLLNTIFTEFYKPGDYVLAGKSQTIRQMNFINPKTPDLAYYEVYHREVTGFITHESILKLKELANETKG